MPNLKISKLRQFLGEKLGQEEKKTIQTDVFQALEAEMVLRREGTETLLKHTELYLRNISKTKVGEGEGGNKEKEKAMPVELLGKAFVGHAGMFEEGSAYGTALSLLGPALINIAAHQSYLCASTDTLQKSFQGHLDLHATLHKLQSKLEGRRLAYDAAKSRAYKARKEDARIEEEVIAAESKWTETSDAVEECMERIREGEGEMLRALTGFLESGREFYGRCLGEVEGVRGKWVCEVDENLPTPNLSNGSVKETKEKEKERPKIVSRITTGTMGGNEKQTNGYGTLSSSPPSMSMLSTPTTSTHTNPRPSPMQRSKTAPLPPPAPPSSSAPPILRCKFSHEPQDAEELELHEGDLVVLVKEVSQSWAVGYLLDTDGGGRGREGWFPREFCELVEDGSTSVGGGGRERSGTVSSQRSTREAEVDGRSRSGTVSSRRSNHVDNEPETRSRRGTVTSVHSSRLSATAYVEEPEEADEEDVFADVKFGGDREGESGSPFTDTTPTGTIGRSVAKKSPPPPPPSRSTKPGMAMRRQESVDAFYATPSASTHSLNDSSSTTPTATANGNGRSRKSSLSDVLTRSRKASTASIKQLQVQEEKVGLLVAECGECGCDEFQANVFKKGQCNNCFHAH
ncbi:BAR-domain-containing protein [Saitoella complicata NRRL Y-17804]|uniref:BAR-domain-containing protein n=1 Tax=Saitoella complicata (strain BCRC 22490 / CBS 7301 / JCM 7358 / NBRC 10748 / NRRL Y-17804) TaxID=698492 RepID=UPI000867F7BC|nr:BAR-domain-containing protein [Saitoella complicata NRRL Y-17804]ODQ52435.1 BAR-domain-containing protein [Saitoella complicata NRRL Y-17804]